MSSWSRFFVDESASGLEFRTFLSPAAHHQAERIREAAKLVGRGEAEQIAQRAGAYELADELVSGLRGAGLTLPANGEVPALSPGRWVPFSQRETISVARAREEWKTEGLTLAGFVLPPDERAALLSFLHATRSSEPPSAWTLFEIADHFFLRDSWRVALQYTGPRPTR